MQLRAATGATPLFSDSIQAHANSEALVESTRSTRELLTFLIFGALVHLFLLYGAIKETLIEWFEYLWSTFTHLK